MHWPVSKKPHFFTPNTFLVHPKLFCPSSEHSFTFTICPEIWDIHNVNDSAKDNGVVRTLKQLRTSKGDYYIRQ